MAYRDIGKLGERDFSVWCTACGFSANSSSEEDKNGWDFVVETPGVEQIGEDGLIDESPFECKVQIKSTDKRDGYVDIALDKLWRLAVDLYPAFIIFIEYDGCIEAQRVYVKHVDQELIRRVLQKIHEAEQSQKPSRYNRRTIRVRYSSLTPIEKPYGESLGNALIQYAPKGMAHYASEKRRFNKDVGREEGGFSLHVTVEGQDNIERMIENSVGITTSFQVARVIGTQVRFGIKKKQPDIDHEGGLLRIESNHFVSATLVLRVAKYSPELRFAVTCHSSPFNSLAPAHLHLIRVYNEFIDLRVYPGTDIIRSFISHDGQQELDLSVLRDRLTVISHLAKGKTLLAELILHDGEKVGFSFGANPLTDIDVSEIDRQLEIVNASLATARQCGWTTSVKASLPDLYSQMEPIILLHDLLSGIEHLMISEFDVAEDIPAGQQVTAIYILSARIGDLQAHALLTFQGPCLRLSAHKYRIEAAPSIERLLVHEASALLDHADVIDIVDSLIASSPDSLFVGLNIVPGQ